MKKSNKTVGIRVKFFTNGLPELVDGRIPAFPKGCIGIEPNDVKGVKPVKFMFNSLEEIPGVIRKTLKKAGVVVLV